MTDPRDAEIRALREALKPFVDELYNGHSGDWPSGAREDDEMVFFGREIHYGDLTYGDFRRAHEVLSRTTQPASSPDGDKDAWIAEAVEVLEKCASELKKPPRSLGSRHRFTAHLRKSPPAPAPFLGGGRDDT